MLVVQLVAYGTRMRSTEMPTTDDTMRHASNYPRFEVSIKDIPHVFDGIQFR